jgi:hypothetical protein
VIFVPVFDGSARERPSHFAPRTAFIAHCNRTHTRVYMIMQKPHCCIGPASGLKLTKRPAAAVAEKFAGRRAAKDAAGAPATFGARA